MTRNVKRFLALSLLSLTPSVAFAAEQQAYGDFDVLFQRSEYVSADKVETFELQARHFDGGASLATTSDDNFYIGNWTGVNTFPGYSLLGTPAPLPPNPLPPIASPSLNGYFRLTLPAQTHSQIYYYTTNPADPGGAAKTCYWQLNITFDPATATCTGTFSQTALGTQGVICGFYGAQSFIDPATCYAQIVTSIQ